MSNILTCVYCGHQYPEGTPPHGSQILTDHIRICEKHPMRKLELENAHLKEIIANRSTEEEILGEIFNGSKKWQGKFRLWYCDLCDTFSIGCTDKACTGSSCNAGGCEKCIETHQDFNKNAKTNPKEYLNPAEQEVYEKIFWLKKYMKESLLESEYEINWKRMKQQGELCQLSKKIFAAEIEKSFMEGDPDITYGEY